MKAKPFALTAKEREIQKKIRDAEKMEQQTVKDVKIGYNEIIIKGIKPIREKNMGGSKKQ